MVKTVWSMLNEQGLMRSDRWENDVAFVRDRQGHDFRYAINQRRLSNALKDLPAIPFNKALQDTVEFYMRITNRLK